MARPVLSLGGAKKLVGHEGWRTKVYADNDGSPTIGPGLHVNTHVSGVHVRIGETYDNSTILGWVSQTFTKFSSKVSSTLSGWDYSKIKLALFDALVSLCWNCGSIDGLKNSLNTWYNSNFTATSLLRQAWLGFKNTAKVSGKTISLASRRQKEVDTFLSVNDGPEESIYTYENLINSKNSGISGSITSSGALADSGISSANLGVSVLTDSGLNIYSSLPGTENNLLITSEHTRIYKYTSPTLKVAEMSMRIDGGTGTYNVETGAYDGDEKNADGLDNIKANLTPSGSLNDMFLGRGVSYPMIRINDTWLTDKTIKYVKMRCEGFIPTIELAVTTTDSKLLKLDVPKEGDKINVFCGSSHGMVKSLRCDFVINLIINPLISQLYKTAEYTILFFGELYIPTLYNSNMSFSFSGSSRDALIDVASKLELGFFFSDPMDTNDGQLWYCMALSPEENSPTVLEYILDVAAHAWKDDLSFFDCWIDFRYGLTFVNVNLLLGANGPDESFDATFFNTIFGGNASIDNKHGSKTDLEKKSDPLMMAKIITNVPLDNEAATAFYALDIQEINLAHEITKLIGVELLSSLNFANPGLAADDLSVPMQYSIIYNPDKYTPDTPGKGGYYILIGPGTNESYPSDDKLLPYALNNVVHICSGLYDMVLSDSDGQTIVETGDNMSASGNTNKFFDIAKVHNYINNMQLKKKYIKITLQGLNLSLMRGEKIPLIIIDNDRFSNMMGTGGLTSGTTKEIVDSNTLNWAKYVNACIHMDYTGWFIIQSVGYIYDPENGNNGTPWKTELTVTRREWPIPGYIDSTVMYTGEGAEIPENNEIPNVVQTPVEPPKQEETVLPEPELDKMEGDEMPLDGLASFMKDIYRAIKNAAKELTGSGSSVKLVGARRYAINEQGAPVDGGAFLQYNSTKLYLAKDSNNKLLYLNETDRYNRHLFGEAIDVINGSGLALDDIVEKIIIRRPEILHLMYLNGVSCFKETSQGGGITSAHYHIGTHTGVEQSFWNIVAHVNGTPVIDTGDGHFSVNTWASKIKALQNTALTVKEIDTDALNSLKQSLNG